MALESVLQRMETVVSAHAVLSAHNQRLAEKRAQYEAGLKALRDQVAALEAVQADMIKESQLISQDLDRMKDIQSSLSRIESLARKGELVEAKGARL